MLKMLDRFLQDSNEFEMYITGYAGYGKTTSLIEVVKYFKSNDINFNLVAFTHKAKDNLIAKVKEEATTLASYLKVRPFINSKAENLLVLNLSTQVNEVIPQPVLVVDEFSMISERDYFRIGELTEEHNLKVIFVGDIAQLPPIGGNDAVIKPYGSYIYNLKVFYRSDKLANTILKVTSQLPNLDTMQIQIPKDDNIVVMDSFIAKFLELGAENCKILSYTNQRVEGYNTILHSKLLGKEIIVGSDAKASILLGQVEEYPTKVNEIEGNYTMVTTSKGLIDVNSKYNPLKQLKQLGIKLYRVRRKGEVIIIPAILGSYNYKKMKDTLSNSLILCNKLKKDSKVAYKRLITFDLVYSIDYNYASTVHKMQGMEKPNIFIDVKSFKSLKDVKMYNKLLYVALTRATKKIFVNSL